MFNTIEDKTDRYQIVWDLGRRCSYSCSYCPPHRNNKTSSFIDYNTLCKTMDSVAEYASLYDTFRDKQSNKKISFTGGEPTVHPDFFKLLEYIKNNYSNYGKGLTTNGWFGNKVLDKVKLYTDTGTISYHCEASDRMKRQVIDNIIELKDNYKVNVMFHKDYFDECISVCEVLEQNNVKYIPRIIGDEDVDENAIKKGYAHRYNRKQMKWFRDFWRERGQQTAESGNSQKGLGRPCCGGRTFKLDGAEANFLPSTNFYGWSCMVNWYFLFLNSELDVVYTHQTCAVNLDSNVAPLGKISEFEKIIDQLEHYTYVEKTIPMIKCPKTFCGCGMCITKAKTNEDILNLFNKKTKHLKYSINNQKDSSYENDITIKRLFKEVK